ncbi:hypothetical protein G5B40_00740 [Pikeienuella piscinae]|uniref:Uncharacterized protein n=1 Tax=Pikeienuella piscinae TaxID=2748098 RepID=A0A7L5BUL6_9RHOB|nr:hypothetical protein [Pikeienuella piscinae]QIE54097.1 hypothetical protein G5B40_00740 [Pikeienuella piscinae]
MSSRPSPLPNRVTPFGEIVAAAAQGGWLGNRGGRIHRDWRIVRRQASPRWIICRLEFKGRRRTVMGDGYTELFFLDEATALAAGHRPCYECRRDAAKAFAAAWAAGRGGARVTADEMDAVLKMERRAQGPTVAHADLAPGAMVAAGGDAFLFDGSGFHRWSFTGYAPAAPKAPLTLLTPASTLAALRAGYRAEMRV